MHVFSLTDWLTMGAVFSLFAAAIGSVTFPSTPSAAISGLLAPIFSVLVLVTMPEETVWLSPYVLVSAGILGLYAVALAVGVFQALSSEPEPDYFSMQQARDRITFSDSVAFPLPGLHDDRTHIRGWFTYTWVSPEGERIKERYFEGTLEQFLEFNERWQPCKQQEWYRQAARQMLERLYRAGSFSAKQLTAGA